MKGGERIFKAYQSCPLEVLKIVDEEHLLFHVKSETSPNLWYSVSLKTHYCDCPDRVSTCKHIYGVQSIVKEFCEGPKEDEEVEEALPTQVNIEDMKFLTPSEADVQKEETSSIDVVREKSFNMVRAIESLCQATIYGDNDEEVRRKFQALQACFRILSEPPTFERPNTITLPLRGSIASVQENVKRTRMGHGRKRIISEVGEASALRPPLKRNSHVFISQSKQKRAIFRKLPKVTCDICATKTLIEGGANSIFCKNCDHEIFVK